MNNAIILQQVYQDSAYTEMAALTLGRHLQYAKRHGFDYEFYYGNIIPEWNPDYGGWAKLALIANAMERGYQHVIWVDTDAIIADLSADLRAGCPPHGIGATRNTLPKEHINVGMLYVTNAPDVLDFVKYWIAWYPGPDGWREQAALNLLLCIPSLADAVTPIEYKYNSCRAGGTQVENPVVEAFHGEGDASARLDLMKAYLKRIGQDEQNPK